MKFLFAIIGMFLSTSVFAMTEELLPEDISCLLSQNPFSPQKQTDVNVDEFNISGLFSQTSNPLQSPIKASQEQYMLDLILSQASNASAGWGVEFPDSDSDSNTIFTEGVFNEDSEATIDNQEHKKKKRKVVHSAVTRKSSRTPKPKSYD